MCGMGPLAIASRFAHQYTLVLNLKNTPDPNPGAQTPQSAPPVFPGTTRTQNVEQKKSAPKGGFSC